MELQVQADELAVCDVQTVNGTECYSQLHTNKPREVIDCERTQQTHDLQKSQ